jgi:tetratricopeptide (TPR) repeat protein
MSRLVGIALAIALAGAVVAPRADAAAAPADSAAVAAASKRAWTRARALADSARHDQALVVVREALRRAPDDTDLLWLEAGIEGWAGRHANAVALYTRLGERHPELLPDLRSDLAAERLWSGDANGAVRDFDLRLAEAPDDLEAARMRALALAYADRHKESLAAYDTLLVRAPTRIDLQLERATVLAWMGRHDDARHAYRLILAVDPTDVRARLGLAQNESWAGRPRVASQLYREMVNAGDSIPEVRKGLAFSEYESGLAEPARESIAGYLAIRPDDHEGAELAARLQREESPVLTTRYDHADDSDDLTVGTTTVEYRWPLAGETVLTLLAKHDDADDPAGDRDLFQWGGGIEKRWSETWTARAALSILNREPDGRVALGDLSSTWRPTDMIRVDAGIARQPIVTRIAIDERILARSLGIGADARVSDRVTVTGSLRFLGYSDGNSSAYQSATARVLAHAERAWRATVRFDLEHLAADQDLDHGYYDPESDLEYGAGLEAEWSPRRGVSLGTVARLGGQHEEGLDTRPFYNVLLTADLPVARLISFHLEGGRSNSNLTSASGYQRNRWAAALNAGF